jgi:hypothetical protein
MQRIFFLLSDYAFNETNSIPELVKAVKRIPDLKSFVDNLSSDQLEGIKPIIEAFEESEKPLKKETRTTLRLFFERQREIIYHNHKDKDENELI